MKTKKAKKVITIDYDFTADVMYLWFGKPRPTVADEFGNIAVHRDRKTKEVVGALL